MVDNLGSHTAENTNCISVDGGITSGGGDAEILIEHVDPVFIDDYIIGSDNDYVAISYSGKFPSITQEAHDGSVITHEMVKVSIQGKFMSLMINPSPNADLGIIDDGGINPFDEMRSESRVILTTQAEERYNSTTKESETWMVAYAIIEGAGIKLGESMYEQAVLGTARTRVRISFNEETIVTGIVFGNKKFKIAELQASEMREDEETETAIGKEARLSYARNSAKGFCSKLSKIYDINGGL